ncbi:MAG: prolyl oligopeptidase family serine peptidase [Acidimicrobiales bacterium]
MTTSPSALSPALADFPARYARTARFTLGTPRNLRAVGGGGRVLFCRSKASEDPVLCLWELDVARGTERLVVDPAALFDPTASLPPAERARRERARESASGIVTYATDDGATRACFALAGALFVVDLASGAVSAPDVAGSVYDPRLNGPGTAVAYVDGGDLRVVELDGRLHGSADRVLRSDPDPAVSFGRAEFVAAEEMQRQAGYWWAPDGRRLLVARVDENPVATWWIGDPAHPGREPLVVRYPAAGTANATVGLELVALDGSAQPIDWSEGGRYEYLADVVWSGDRPPLVVRQTRDQRTVSIAEIDPATGAVAERRAVTDGIWVELVAGSPRWCAAGLLTVEDQGAARRLVLDGTPLTGDDHQIRALLGLAERPGGGQAAVVSLTVGDEPGEIQIGLVPLAGAAGADGGPDPASLELLTTAPGVHGGVVDGATVVLTATGPEPGPARITVHRLDGPGSSAPGEAVATITDHGVQAGFAAAPLFCRLGADELPSALFLPSDHDGSSPLPVLLDPYGGPHAQRVLKNHNPHLVSRWFAEHGYAVVVTDGRGTPGRGPAWERAVRGDLAGPALDDQLAALDAALERHPFLDASRVAIRGWSFGGYLAALALLSRPDRFASAVAGAPVTDWRLYDTHYTERYLGHPAQHPEHYRRSNLWWEGEGNDATGLELAPLTRPLLLIHGLADDNVVAAHTLRFSTALLSAGYPHRVLPLSGVTHMTPQVAVAENLLRLQLAFLDETLATPTPPAPQTPPPSPGSAPAAADR